MKTSLFEQISSSPKSIFTQTSSARKKKHFAITKSVPSQNNPKVIKTLKIALDLRYLLRLKLFNDPLARKPNNFVITFAICILKLSAATTTEDVSDSGKSDSNL